MAHNSKYIISGGGTGGHIFPAISIADALKEKEPECSILFVGAAGKMEMEKVPAAGYEIKGIPVTGLQRKLSLENLKLPFKLAKSMAMAKKIIRDFRPDAVIGVGGYASAPTLWCAQRSGIPTIIQEQNSYAGLTNRIVGKKAKAICVAYQDMERFFPGGNIIMTGNPVRSSIRKYTDEDKAKAIGKLGLDQSKKTLFVVGGSLGSRTLNESVKKWIANACPDEIQLIWQYGRYYKAECEKFLSENENSGFVKGHDFIKDMDSAYAASDLIISRAGAGTISELAIAGKAVIFVPSPNVTEDHQTHNAMALCKKDAALMVSDLEAPEKLMDTAMKLIANKNRLTELENNISIFAMPRAAEKIVEQIEIFKRK